MGLVEADFLALIHQKKDLFSDDAFTTRYVASVTVSIDQRLDSRDNSPNF